MSHFSSHCHYQEAKFQENYYIRIYESESH